MAGGVARPFTRARCSSARSPGCHRLHAVGKVPTVAAMGSRAPKGAAAKHTEQSAHQAAIWVALEYAGQCLSKGSEVTLTVASVTALRNLHDAPAGEEARPGRRPGRGGGADAAQRRSGQADAGQRQQATAPQRATRPQEGEGGGGESCEAGREAKPHRDEHQEQAAARGAEPKIPR